MSQARKPQPSGPGPARTFFYLGLAFVVFWVLYLRFFGPGMAGEEPQLEGTALAEPADYTWPLADLDGNVVEFSKYKGKTVFLNIWATWCGPCVREMPTIAALAAMPEMKDVAFVCVATDDTAGPVKSFLKDKSWPMTILHTQHVPRVFATDGIPATFLIAPDGRVAASQVGSAKWDAPNVVAFLGKLNAGGKK
ncbi:MAG: TlpA disulfide reductase family protein [Isosphaeraceae bacterium]